MLPTQEEFEALLRRLREEQTESPIIDGKEDLALQTEGDRAELIRHVAALSNNVERSYLIIGVEDRTWNPVGLTSTSPLRGPDETQRRLNQVLANRVDPNISVRYRTYEADGVMYGLIVIEGRSAPYIVAIEDQEYGGNRTHGAPSSIYRGAIYVRRGANSVIANRQSEVLNIISRAQQFAGDAQPDKFLTAWNYLDIDSEDFGHHSLSKRLVEMHSSRDKIEGEYAPAQSWVSFVSYPVNGNCEVDTLALKDKLKPDQRIGRGPEWYRGVPRPFLQMLYSPRSTPREFVAWWHPSDLEDKEITHFIRIVPSGHMEIGCVYPLFLQIDGVRFFSFVNLIGYLWQMTYLSKAIYDDTGFYGEAAISVNFVGTNGTRLADLAKSQRGGWPSPFSFEYTPSKQDVYLGSNIQIERILSLAGASDEEIENVVRDIARDIGAYYGQDRPRCFDHHTNEFPYRQYATWM